MVVVEFLVMVVVWGLLVLLGLEVVELVGEVWEVGVKVAVGVVVEMVEEVVGQVVVEEVVGQVV